MIIKKHVSLVIGLVVIALTIAVSSFAWTEPTASPPGDNVSTPINVGSTLQSKSGAIGATMFYDNPDSSYYLDPDGESVLNKIYTESGVTDNLIADPQFSTDSYWNNTGAWNRAKVVLDNGDVVNAAEVITSGNVQIYSDYVTVNPYKTYRFTIWMKSNSTTGTRYLGLDAYNSSKGEISSYNSGGASGSNMYFWSGDLDNNVWRKITGYIFPCNAGTGWTNPPDTTYRNFRMSCNAKYLRMRFLNYYNSGTVVSNWFALPKVEEVQDSITAFSHGNSNYIIMPNGNVGIGDKAPSVKLDVEGAVGATAYCDESGGNCKTMAELIGGGDTTPDTIADDDWIQETEIVQNTLDDSEIQDNSLTAGSLAANSVGNSELIDAPTVTGLTLGGVYRTSWPSGAGAAQTLGTSGNTITLSDGGGSVTAPYAVNADTVDTYHVSTTRNAANTVPVRDGSGYLQLGWINTTSGSAGTNAPLRIYGSQDSYLRYYTAVNFATVMAAYQQKRVTGTCAVGSSIRIIDANGGVTCEVDNSGSGGDDLGNHVATGNLNMSNYSVNNVQNITTANRVMPGIVLDSTNTGDDWTSQGAYVAIGEGATSLTAAGLYLTYRGDGYGWIGSGAVSNAVPGASYLRFDYDSSNIYTPDNLQVGTIDTGYGNFEVGQHLRTTDSPTFANITASGGISTYDTTVADNTIETSQLCLGNGTNCRTTWPSGGGGTPQTLGTSGNTITLTDSASITAPYAINADTVDTYHVSTTRNEANTIPVRNASGYLNLGWINTTSGSAGTNAPLRIYGSQDSYLRYYTPANFATVMASYQQRRVNGNCNGEVMVGIGVDGVPVCETDDSGGAGGSPGGASGYVQYNDGAGGFGGESAFFYNATNNRIGIGDTTPSYPLDVAGNVRSQSGWFRSTGDYGLYNETDGTYLYSDSAGYLRTRSDTGISIANRANTTRGYLYHNNANGFGLLDADGNWVFRSERDSYNAFSVNNSEKMRVKSDGNVGIGTTNPGTNRLEVVGGPIKATGGLIIQQVASQAEEDAMSPQVGQMWIRTDL